jgi:hypothetical protein
MNGGRPCSHRIARSTIEASCSATPQRLRRYSTACSTTPTCSSADRAAGGPRCSRTCAPRRARSRTHRSRPPEKLPVLPCPQSAGFQLSTEGKDRTDCFWPESGRLRENVRKWRGKPWQERGRKRAALLDARPGNAHERAVTATIDLHRIELRIHNPDWSAPTRSCSLRFVTSSTLRVPGERISTTRSGRQRTCCSVRMLNRSREIQRRSGSTTSRFDNTTSNGAHKASLIGLCWSYTVSNVRRRAPTDDIWCLAAAPRSAPRR